jgi:hypothetical protein
MMRMPHFGASVSTAGDVNGDGYTDVIVGAPYYTNGQTSEGAARLYLGSSTGLDTNYDNHDEGNDEGARFGTSVSMAGDVNGDGYADVIVGAPYYTNDSTDEGMAFVWYGQFGWHQFHQGLVCRGECEPMPGLAFQ